MEKNKESEEEVYHLKTWEDIEKLLNKYENKEICKNSFITRVFLSHSNAHSDGFSKGFNLGRTTKNKTK